MNAEQAVLGAMLKSKDAADIALISLVPNDFQDAANRLIFAAMQSLNQHCRPIDLVTVDEQLTKFGKLDEVGGAAYLVELNNKGSDIICNNVVPLVVTMKKEMKQRKNLMRIQFTDGGYADVDPERVIIINAASIKAIRPITGDESEVET